MVELSGPSATRKTGISCRVSAVVKTPGHLVHAAGKPLCRFTVEASGSLFDVLAKDDLADFAASLNEGEYVLMEGPLLTHNWRISTGIVRTVVLLEPDTIERT